jgi:uncharacterized membrane protein YkoI
VKLRLALAALCVSATSAFAAPKVSQAEARKIALAKVPGTIVHEKLKHKKDHDFYFIQIKPKNAPAKSQMVKKVEIDADTGQVVKVKDIKAKAKDESMTSPR